MRERKVIKVQFHQIIEKLPTKKLPFVKHHSNNYFRPKKHQWMLKLVGKKYDEKQDIHGVSKYLPPRHLQLLTEKSTFTVERSGR